MSTNPTATDADKPPVKSKKMLIIAIVAAVLLVVAGVAVAWVMSTRHAVDEDGEEDAPRAAAVVVVPTFLPMETMVVNLADAGGERFAQIGITLELADDKTADKVKQYMPSIRSGILLLVSQRTSDELLLLEGKEKLAIDIAREVSRPLGFGTTATPNKRAAAADADEDEDVPVKRRKTAASTSPVHKVHFSGFIIQ